MSRSKFHLFHNLFVWYNINYSFDDDSVHNLFLWWYHILSIMIGNDKHFNHPSICLFPESRNTGILTHALAVNALCITYSFDDIIFSPLWYDEYFNSPNTCLFTESRNTEILIHALAMALNALFISLVFYTSKCMVLIFYTSKCMALRRWTHAWVVFTTTGND